MKEVADAVRAKADELLAAEAEVARLEADLDNAKKRADSIAREMPEIMEENEVAELTLTDGTKFVVKSSTFVNLTKDNRSAFYQWCEEHGLAGVIKTTISVPVGKGEIDKADQLIALLGEGVELTEDGVVKFEAGRESKIEPSTLRKLANDRLEAGEDWPQDLAPISIVEKVEIKRPKKK